ncbi:MAG TPA: helix-turn-helix domain-containing protein [Thermomicrobiales bacterium]|nr:helix-turn-helix domain-containing protein [Thermomicrobiales bacterium]
MSDGERLMTISQAARRLGVSAATLRNWANRGRLAHITLPSGYRRFPAEEVERLRREMGYGRVRRQETTGPASPLTATALRALQESFATWYATYGREMRAHEAGLRDVVEWRAALEALTRRIPPGDFAPYPSGRYLDEPPFPDAVERDRVAARLHDADVAAYWPMHWCAPQDAWRPLLPHLADALRQTFVCSGCGTLVAAPVWVRRGRAEQLSDLTLPPNPYMFDWGSDPDGERRAGAGEEGASDGTKTEAR